MPLGTGGIGEFSEDGKRLTAAWSTPDSPTEVYAIDVTTGKAAPLRKEPRPSLAGLPKVTASIVEIPAFDGLKLPTNVYLPADAPARSCRCSSSTTADRRGPRSSAGRRRPLLPGLGYAVVEPNVRGSSGFGRAFEAADNGPKRLDAFKDIETTARWVASQPWADKERLVVYGGSYGGYTMLIAL